MAPIACADAQFFRYAVRALRIWVGKWQRGKWQAPCKEKAQFGDVGMEERKAK